MDERARNVKLKRGEDRPLHALTSASYTGTGTEELGIVDSNDSLICLHLFCNNINKRTEIWWKMYMKAFWALLALSAQGLETDMLLAEPF